MFSDVEAMLHREIDKLTAERDTLQNEVYDLKHVIQHWEVDCDGLKDDVEQLTAERDALKVECESHRLEREGRRERIEVLQADNERLRAEVANWQDIADKRMDAGFRAHTQLTELADAAELVMRSDYTGYTHRLLERALTTIGRGPYEPYGSPSAEVSPEQAQLREAAEAVRDRHELETLVTPEAMRFCAVLAKVAK